VIELDVESVKKLLPKYTLKLCFDLKYRIPHINTLQNILQRDWLNRKQYVREFFDCDDFAICLKAHFVEQHQINAIGVVIDIISRHAYNVALAHDDDLNISCYVIEPQTDEIFPINQRPLRRYFLWLSMILV